MTLSIISHTVSQDSPFIKLGATFDAVPITFADFFRLLRDDQGACDVWIDALRDAPYDGFFWEMPPLTAEWMGQPFECVLVEGNAMGRLTPDAEAFRDKFDQALDGATVTVFSNLGGSSTLIAPLPLADHEAYTHIASFVRRAPREQVQDCFRTVAEIAGRVIQQDLVWLSTAGFGVSWLHVRFDPRPKYYRHDPYKDAQYWAG